MEIGSQREDKMEKQLIRRQWLKSDSGGKCPGFKARLATQ